MTKEPDETKKHERGWGAVTDLLQMVMDGMRWDKKKAQLWFNTPNPLLGGAIPNGYELMCGKERLEKFIKQQLSENKLIRG